MEKFDHLPFRIGVCIGPYQLDLWTGIRIFFGLDRKVQFWIGWTGICAFFNSISLTIVLVYSLPITSLKTVYNKRDRNRGRIAKERNN